MLLWKCQRVSSVACLVLLFLFSAKRKRWKGKEEVTGADAVSDYSFLSLFVEGRVFRQTRDQTARLIPSGGAIGFPIENV